MRRLYLLTLLLATGCPREDPAQGLQLAASTQLFDYDGFVCGAMPVLIRRCSYLACHGDATHALRVYSPGKLRLGDTSTRAARDAQLTVGEVQANFDAATGVLLAAPTVAAGHAIELEDTPLLQKPLAARFGGDEHAGIGIFPVYPAKTLADDAEWTALVKWVAGQKQSPPDAACKALFDALGMAPR